jgi:hypothetical protein
MSLIFQIPKQSRFIQTVNVFPAAFNVPLGQYGFALPLPIVPQVVLKLNTNSIYVIDRVNVGADIPENDYAENIDVLPRAALSFYIEGQRVYPLPLPLVNYVDNQECLAWVWSDKGGDQLMLSMTEGVLNQSSALVGRATIKMYISFNIYEISDNNFIQQFKGSSTSSAVGFSAPMDQTRAIHFGNNPSTL